MERRSLRTSMRFRQSGLLYCSTDQLLHCSVFQPEVEKRRRRDSNPRDPCGPTGFQDLMTLMTLRSFLHFTLFHTLFIAILLSMMVP